jgi:hypothetical protein
MDEGSSCPATGRSTLAAGTPTGDRAQFQITVILRGRGTEAP